MRLALFTDVTVHMEDGWLDLVPERPVGVVTVEDAPPRRVGCAAARRVPPGPAGGDALTEARSLPDGLEVHVSGLDSLDIERQGSTSWPG